MTHDKKSAGPGILISLFPVLFLVFSLIIAVTIFRDDTTGGPAQSVLILSGVFASVIYLFYGGSWKDLEVQVIRTMGDVMQPVLILLLIGALIGVWILSGIVPSIIVWGLKILSPSIFLFASCIISAIVSLATGSSWSTAGTIGVALIGIGQATGINMGMTAGAIISGAYFGDKLSPFSETTNLASSMTGTGLFVHIRHMLYTTIPAMTVALVLFLILGLTRAGTGYDPARIQLITGAINSQFDTSLYMLLPPVLTIIILMRRVPAIPAIIAGILMGVIFAVIFQPARIIQMAQDPSLSYTVASIKTGLKTASSGFVSSSGIREVDSLLNKGGMSSMLNTIWIILSAMFFAGVMEGSGMLRTIAEGILRSVRGTGNLVAATVATTVLTNVLAADQYLSIVITGRMYREPFARRGLHSKNLSRILEDAGTLTSPLVPWNTCGSFMASTLGVSTFMYLPFAFLNLLTPFISILYGYTGFTIEKIVHYDEDETVDTDIDHAS